MHSLTVLRDYLAVLTNATNAGDTARAAEAVATMKQELHLLGLNLPQVVPAITHSNGVYLPPADLQPV